MIEMSSGITTVSDESIMEQIPTDGELLEFSLPIPEFRDGAISGETRRSFLKGMFTAAGHMANERPAGVAGEWVGVPKDEQTLLQKIAEVSNGWITAANVVTILGFLATLKGGVEYARGNQLKGLACIAAGRVLGDALDGPIARYTRTRGEKGAALDAAGDKVLTFLAAIALPALGVVQPEYAVKTGVKQATISLDSLAIQKMGGEPNPTESGKDAMRYIWEAFGAGAVTQMLEQRGHELSAFMTRKVGKHVQRKSLVLMDKAIAQTHAQRSAMDNAQAA